MTRGSKSLAIAAAAAAALAASAAAQASETIAYSYDARGRLVQVARSGTVNNGVTTTYTLDKADNRTAVTVSGAGSPPAAPAGAIVLPGNGYRIIPTG